MSALLQDLAGEVGVHERTLRRAVGDGLIRARRLSPRKLTLADSESDWVRAHWDIVARVKAVLRTEPNVALAVLFGSVARGDETPGSSDVDLLVALRTTHPGALSALNARLQTRLDMPVQLVALEAARRQPRLLAEVLRDGRPLVDRDAAWVRLQAARQQTLRDAAAEDRALRQEARAAVDYFRRLAAARAREGR